MIVELFLQMPIEIKAIIGSGIILALLQYKKDKVWEKEQQENHRLRKY